MTNDFKDITMQYLAGKMTTQPISNQVYFEQSKTTKNDFETQLQNTYFQYGYTIDGKIQGLSNTSEGLEFIVFFGKYKKTSSDGYNHSYIMILDEKYNIIQVIKNYSNGEEFGKILGLNVGDDGRFFAIEKDTNNYYRIVLMNNIVAKLPSQANYRVVQRQTYRVTDQSYFADVGISYDIKIVKQNESARYVMWGFEEDNSDIINVRALEFVINVGSTNEWNYVGNLSQRIYLQNPVFDWKISWNNSNQFQINIHLLNESTYESNTHIFYEEINKSYTENIFRHVVSYPPVMRNLNISNIHYKQLLFKDSGGCYLSISISNKYYLYNVVNDDYSTPFFEQQMTAPANFRGIHLLKNKGNVFYTYQNGNTTYVGVLVNETMYSTQATQFNANKTLFLESMQSIFNLYTLYIQAGDYINVYKLPYIDKTNNQSYKTLQSLIPYFGKLYDTNNNLVFARTLYNLNVSGQTTTSIIQVPNQYLNNVTIGNEKLIGKTYIGLNNDTEAFQKNQYEEVFVNFANSLVMINENDENNPIINNEGAARLNLAISKINDYTSIIASKYRINYYDGSSITSNFLPSQITLVAGETRKYRFTFPVYNCQANEIKSIDIMSADGNTIYQKIIDMQLDQDKLYTLTQDVYMV